MPSEDDDTSMARRSWACKAIIQRCLQTTHSVFMNQVNELCGVTAKKTQRYNAKQPLLSTVVNSDILGEKNSLN